MQFLRREFEHLAQCVAEGMAALAAERQRHPVAAGVVIGNEASCIEVVGNQALVHQRQRHHVRRSGEHLGGRRLFAQGNLEGDIARTVRPDLDGAFLQGRGGADHMGQCLPLQIDGLGSVSRLVQRIGHHKGHRIADVTHLATRQHRIGRHWNINALDAGLHRHQANVRDVVAGQHQAHTGHRPRLRHIEFEPRMGVRRTYHHRAQRVCGNRIGDIAAVAAQQRVVFLAPHRLAEAEFFRDRLHTRLDCSHALADPSTIGRTGCTANPRWSCLHTHPSRETSS